MQMRQYPLSSFFALLAAILAMFASTLSAQDNKDIIQMGTSALKDEAMALVNQKKYLDARPYMEQLILRIQESENEKLKDQLESLYFFMAFSYIQENVSNPTDMRTIDRAIEYFDKVIKEFPKGEYVAESIRQKAQCYLLQRKFAESAQTREMLLRRPYVDSYSNSEQLEIINEICRTFCYNEKDWVLGEKWFELLLSRSKSIDDKSFAASMLIQISIKKKDFTAAKKYFPYLVYDTPSRADIKLNISFLTAGDSLVKENKYSDAALFYSMAFTKNVILEKLNSHIEKTKKAINYQRMVDQNAPRMGILEGNLKSLEMQVGIVKDIDDYTVDLMARSARNFLLTERFYESFWSYWQLLREFPKHQSIEDFYFAAFVGANKIGKKDEMYKLGLEYLKEFPDGLYIREVRLYNAMYMIDLKEYDAFFAEARKFIEEYPEEPPYSSDFIYLMGKTWLDLGKYSDMIKTFSDYTERYPDTVISEACLYWTGIAYLASGDFKNSAETLRKMIDIYPNGPYAEDGSYRAGVAFFAIGEFTVARDIFEDFTRKYDKSGIRGEVEFFLGDIYAGVNQLDLAMKHYMDVEKYTKNQSFIDSAYIQAAKLLHNVEKYEEEVDLMDSYLKKFPKGQRSLAMYNKAIALEMLGLPADALTIYSDAITSYGGNSADDGVDKIILDYDRMLSGNRGKMVATVDFLKRLLKDEKLLRDMVEVPAQRYRFFQANPLIDKRLYEKFKRDTAFGPVLYKNKGTINSLIERYEGQLAKYPQGDAKEVLGKMLADAKASGNQTLEYRLMMGIDASGQNVKAPRMFNEDDMKKASMRTLVWMGRENEAYGPDEARKAFKMAEARDEYEYLIDVLFAEAQLEERQKNWDAVIKIYSKIERDFPSDERAARAALSIADTYSKLGKRAEAEEKYTNILKVPSWRGPAHAEALYMLGRIAQLNGKKDAALMYYDRCFLGFGNCYQITGKAVLAASQLLVESGEKQKAIEICDEFLGNKLNEASPDFAEIKQFRMTL